MCLCSERLNGSEKSEKAVNGRPPTMDPKRGLTEITLWKYIQHVQMTTCQEAMSMQYSNYKHHSQSSIKLYCMLTFWAFLFLGVINSAREFRCEILKEVAVYFERVHPLHYITLIPSLFLKQCLENYIS
jgi:hypothetical protein